MAAENMIVLLEQRRQPEMNTAIASINNLKLIRNDNRWIMFENSESYKSSNELCNNLIN